MYEIKKVVKCYLFVSFTCILWRHPLRSKEILKRAFECLKRWFGFQFKESSCICEGLIRANPWRKKKSALIDDWEIIAYWEESEWNKVLAKKMFLVPKTAGVFCGCGWLWKWCNFRKAFQCLTLMWDHFWPFDLFTV